MIHFINQKIILPSSDLLQNLTISRKFSFLIESQFWSREKLLNYQEIQLQKLLKHASENVPFYSEWFHKNKLKITDIKNHSDLYKLPIISKTEIRKTPEKFIAKNVPGNHLIRLNSSGSTGEPFEYFLSRDAYSMKYAAALRGWTWMGYKLGDTYTKLSQNKRSSKIKRLQDFINRSFYIYIPDLSRNSLENIISTLQKDKPLFLRSYPDPLFFIAKILQDKNMILTGIRAINSTGNILTPEARKLIEERFNCPVYDSYSCEGGALFYEGPERENYLGSMEYAISEVLDKNHNETNGEVAGMHITTDLHNYAMPMIRYNTQDMVEKSTLNAKSGHNLIGFKSIIGRENDILITPSGNLLIVHLFTIYFEYFDCIKQFQIEQTQKDLFIFRLVVDGKFTSEIHKQIQKYWQEFLGKNVQVNIEIHENIPVLYSGKRRFLIRNPEIKLDF
ncbi:MAG: phenylacetate--CoA ligase family protein [Bacteroidales bacterium]|nr:phenylacetate--CoA ligase family protein [Bacteroidales bacterium]